LRIPAFSEWSRQRLGLQQYCGGVSDGEDLGKKVPGLNNLHGPRWPPYPQHAVFSRHSSWHARCEKAFKPDSVRNFHFPERSNAMRSKTILALAAAGAVALPLASKATGDYTQHRLAFVPHATLETSAYPQSQIKIDEFGGPVNPYVWEQPLNPAALEPREIASFPVPAPSYTVADVQPGSMISAPTEVRPGAAVTQSAPSALSSNGSTVTWYFPDGTVAHQQYPGPAPDSQPGASSGASFSMSAPSESWTSESAGASSGSSLPPSSGDLGSSEASISVPSASSGSDLPGERPGETGTPLNAAD
jgi:hypothetical protein